MEFTSANYQDIRKYYEGTYVKFTEFGDRLFYITDITTQQVNGIDDTDTPFILYLDNHHPYIVNYLLPHKAVFQWKDSVYLLQRVPARQYKRGLCAENTMITNVATGQAVEIGFAALKAFVTKPTYASFSAAINTKVKTRAVALTNRMTYLRTGAILMDSIRIATYDFESKKITMIRKAFEFEIQQHLWIHNDTYEVVV